MTQVTARTAAELADVHRNSAILYFHKLRQCIAAHMAEVEPELAVFECDESYVGGVRKGKRGRGAVGKVCVFGILKRGGRVYALPVADASSKTLLTALKTGIRNLVWVLGSRDFVAKISKGGFYCWIRK